MTAKQTLSASLGWLLCIASPAWADDDAQPPGEVQPKPPEKLVMMPKREPTGTFEIGAGYSTDDGFIASARIAQPRLFGTDKGLALSTSIDERHQQALVRYEDPTLFDTDLRLRGDLYSRRQLFNGFSREAVGGELSLTKRIAPNLDVFAGYKLEHVAVSLEDGWANRSTSPQPFWGGGMIGAVRAGLQYSTIDPKDAYYPRHGTIIGSSLEYADQQLGSDIQYLRTDSWLGHHQPLGPFTLHLGARASSITDSAPMSERLHFDGSSDVRGFPPGAIVPEGGNFQWSARGELETPSWNGLSLAGFVDAGGLYNADNGATLASAGFGIIWRSPIGPLRFDWATPLTGGDRETRFVFGIGGMF